MVLNALADHVGLAGVVFVDGVGLASADAEGRIEWWRRRLSLAVGQSGLAALEYVIVAVTRHPNAYTELCSGRACLGRKEHWSGVRTSTLHNMARNTSLVRLHCLWGELTPLSGLSLHCLWGELTPLSGLISPFGSGFNSVKWQEKSNADHMFTLEKTKSSYEKQQGLKRFEVVLKRAKKPRRGSCF